MKEITLKIWIPRFESMSAVDKGGLLLRLMHGVLDIVRGGKVSVEGYDPETDAVFEMEKQAKGAGDGVNGSN